MDSNSKIKYILILIATVFLYVVCLIVAAAISKKILMFELWSKINQPKIQIYNIEITVTRIMHIILGFPLYIYGLTLIYKTTVQNHTAQNKNTRKPIRLLTKGAYGIRRHPMYTGFICLQVGLWFSLYSAIGYMVACFMVFIVSINSMMEEKNELERIFPEAYEAYKKEVPHRIYTTKLLCYLLVIGVMAIISFLLTANAVSN